jgi:hypothetical protein
MLIRIQRGRFEPHGGDVEPNGDKLWSCDEPEWSAAVLTALNPDLELGTWYRLQDFAELVREIRLPQEHEVMSAITIDQPGVERPWSTAIQIGEGSAAVMICESTIRYAERFTGGIPVWVRVE